MKRASSAAKSAALLAQHGEAAVQVRERRCACGCTEAPRDFLLDVEQAQVALGLLIVERDGQVVEEGQHGALVEQEGSNRLLLLGLSLARRASSSCMRDTSTVTCSRSVTYSARSAAISSTGVIALAYTTGQVRLNSHHFAADTLPILSERRRAEEHDRSGGGCRIGVWTDDFRRCLRHTRNAGRYKRTAT